MKFSTLSWPTTRPKTRTHRPSGRDFASGTPGMAFGGDGPPSPTSVSFFCRIERPENLRPQLSNKNKVWAERVICTRRLPRGESLYVASSVACEAEGLRSCAVRDRFSWGSVARLHGSERTSCQNVQNRVPRISGGGLAALAVILFPGEGLGGGYRR